jgi:hypothetical protein
VAINSVEVESGRETWVSDACETINDVALMGTMFREIRSTAWGVYLQRD